MKNRRGLSLIEMVIVIGLLGIISAMAGPPFVAWFRKSKVEDAASTLHETFKAAQTQAMKRGGVEIYKINNVATPIKKRIYVALNEAAGTYKVVQWRDKNNDGVRDNDEFTVLDGGSLSNGRARFGLQPFVNKSACSDGDSDSKLAIRNFMNCPPVGLLNGQKCMRFDDRGFLTESMQNAGVFMTNDEDTFAISLNPAGIITLCRWSGNGWQFVR